MNSSVTALLAFAVIFGAALLGMFLRSRLPDSHLSPDAKESVRVGMGLVATMTALLLGLLIATAKGSYDTQRAQVIQIASNVGFLDRTLAVYGPETAQARELLHGEVEGAIARIWPEKASESSPNTTTEKAQALYGSLQNLTPQNDTQRALKAQALTTTMDLGKSLWLLSAQREPSIVTPMLIAVVLWLVTIFLSFGLFAPTNKTVLVAMLTVAISVSSALFLMLELDRPFDGLIQISSAPLRNVLSNLGR